MQRSLLVALLVLLAGLAGLTWWLWNHEAAPPAPPPAASGQEVPAAEPVTAGAGTTMGGAEGTITRQAAATGTREGLDDPEIRAGLCGFKGRVVDHLKRPVADSGLRIYRGALDGVLPADFDPFAPAATYVPDYVAGDTRTASDGTWQLTGVWPRAFYLLHAGMGTDAPTWQVVTRTPSPGEIVDLGDIVLPHAGVIVGTVLDDNGDPMPGALVRCADLPGTLAALFPIERFDPDGALLIRERQFPMRVIEMPAWVGPAFEQLPFPRAIAGSDGRFRLVGVVPGSNMVATTAPQYLSDVKASVTVRPGQEKDVGKIRMKRGEELTGVVLDTAGKPVADAEVFAGSTLTIGPVDLAQRLAKTDANGRFGGQGFAPGKVTVAARRGRGHSWVLAEPQSLLGDVQVTLPASFAVDVEVQLADGKPAKAPRLQLLTGKAGQGAAEMFMMGVSQPLDLRDRRKDVAEGRWRLENLNPGAYTLVVDAPGHANGFASFEIVEADTAVKVQLTLPRQFTVQVVDFEDKPVRNAAIFAEPLGKSLIDMPVRCGRTAADGKLVVDKLLADGLRVSAEHPKWGVVHGEVKVGESLLLRMQQPGALHGVLRENGKPPEPGKYSVGIVRERADGEARGPLEQVPGLHTANLDGEFLLKNQQPGKYEVQAVKALDALRSPGGVMALAQEMFMSRGLPRVDVVVMSGATAEVALELGEAPIEGPTARLSGTVTVDGKLAVGYGITANRENRRFSARVDERGRFDFGTVPAGGLQVALLATTEGAFFSGPGATLWSSTLELAENESRELTLDVLTTSVRGVCYLPDGSPAAGVFVQGRGKLKGAERDDARIGVPSDSRGEFHFPQVAEGSWSLNARSNGDVPARGELLDVVVNGGVPVVGLRIEMKALAMVTGRVEMAALPAKVQWSWLAFHQLADSDGPEAEGRQTMGAGIDREKGTFRATNLKAGRYRVSLYLQPEEGDQVEYACGLLEVPEAGLKDVVLRPTLRAKR